MADLFGGDWMPLAASAIGGLLGSKSNGSTSNSTRNMDPRLDRYVYGSDGQSGLLSGAWDTFQKQAAQGGLNDLQRQGMEMQRQYLMSPQYQNSYAGLMGAGQSLLGGGVAGNPFMRQAQAAQQPAAQSAPMPSASYPAAQQQPAFQYDPRTMPASADAYFKQNPDVAAAFAANNYGLTKDQFAQTHFNKYGQYEQRAAPSVGIPDYSMKSAPSLVNPDLAKAAVYAQQAGGYGQTGGQGGGISSGGNSGIGTGQMTDAINSQMARDAAKYMALGLAPAAAIAIVRAEMAKSGVLNAVNQADDPIGALNGVQGWTDTDPGYNAWSGAGYGDGGGMGGWANGGYGFGGGTGGMGD